MTIALDTDHLYATSRWLRVEEDVATAEPLHVSADDRDGGSAFAAAYRFDAASNPWPIARLDLFLRELGARGDTAGVLPCYLVGGRRPGHSRILTSGPAARRGALLDLVLAETADRAAKRGAATVAALYCDDDDTELAAALRRAGGIRFPSHPTYVLDLPGDGFEDWLMALPRKQRLKERADERKLAGVGYEVRPLRSGDVDWIVDLEMGLYHKYGNDYRLTEARALHEAYLDRLGDDALLITATRDGERVGFTSIVRCGDTAFLRQGGFDDERCAGVPVYFGAVFHTAIRWAYASGVRSLDYSISAGAVKRRRGCRELARSAWVVPLTAGARAVLGSPYLPRATT